MENKDLQNLENEDENIEQETQIFRNDEANPNDSAVVIEEEDRTVLLTEDETVIIEKEEMIPIPPKNRPRKPYAGMWGIPEIVTVGLASLAVLSLLIIYLFFVLPSQQNLEDNRAKRDELEKKFNEEKRKYGDITDTETQVAKLITSATDFETRFLKEQTIGKTSIYQRLNALINAYGLTNTSGPDYVPLEISEEERRSGLNENQRGRSKFQSLFPGVYITTTVEGSYFNLRGFLRDIEQSQEFIVISSVELVPAEKEEKNDQQANEPKVTRVNTRGKTRGQVVSLRIEMAAYFQRPADQRNVTAIPDTNEPLEEAIEN